MIGRTLLAGAVLASFVANGARADGFCFGDSGCPCGNDAPTGSETGCLNSLGLPGVLGSAGDPSISADTVVFSAGLVSENAFGMFIVGSTPLAQGTPFHDGLLCVNGTARFGAGNAVGGIFNYPRNASDPAVSTISSAPNESRYYQLIYRNSNPTFCTPGTLNTTNGFEIVWLP